MQITKQPNNRALPLTKWLASKAPVVAVFAMTIAVSTGCSQLPKFSSSADKIVEVPVGRIKPQIDYSSESPDCATAAQRIKDNIVVGMTLADVKRLVGQPRFIMPGSWWWTAGFSNKGDGGKPVVRYGFMASAPEVAISSFGSDSHGCT